jgi:hypothetical protein
VSGAVHATHFVRFPANSSATRNIFPHAQAKLIGMGLVGIEGMRVESG